MLLAAGANANQHDGEGWSPLHLAALAGWADGIGRLLDHGADIDAATNSGSTPLRFAVQESKTDAVTALLARGADHTVSFFSAIPKHGRPETLRPKLLAIDRKYLRFASKGTGVLRKDGFKSWGTTVVCDRRSWMTGGEPC